MTTPYPENVHKSGERQIGFEVVSHKGRRVYAMITAECALNMDSGDIKEPDMQRAIESLKQDWQVASEVIRVASQDPEVGDSLHPVYLATNTYKRAERKIST